MKRFITGLFVGVFLSIYSVGFAADTIKILVNGKEINSDIPPQIINGRTMVPIRFVAEALQANVEWDENTKTVKITTASQPATDPNNKKVGEKIVFSDSELIVDNLETYAVETATGISRIASADITIVPTDGNFRSKSRFFDFIGGWVIDNSHTEITSRIKSVPEYPTDGKYTINAEHVIDQGKFVTAIKIKGDGKTITVTR